MSKETKITQLGRDWQNNKGVVNPPIYQTSTVLFPSLEAYHNAEKGIAFYEGTEGASVGDFGYGIAGTPTTFALQDALKELEGGDNCVITPSGLAAITLTLTALVESGDHILIVDTVYGPTRRFCNNELKKFGVETEYYDPKIGSGIKDLIRKNTKLIFLESPGSLTFEVQDVPAITKVAKAKKIPTVLDNSWATPLFFNPIEHGVDICIHAITKYIGGHSDILLGAIISKGADLKKKILKTFRSTGTSTSPYDCHIALRGLRTLAARMDRHQESTRKVVDWIKDRPEVAKILYPAFEGSEDYDLWKKLYSGSASLFSVVLDKKYPEKDIAKMIDGLEIFGIGASWGGYESLCINFDPAPIRTATKWQEKGSCIRFYIGLENPDDLIADISAGFNRLKGK